MSRPQQVVLKDHQMDFQYIDLRKIDCDAETPGGDEKERFVKEFKEKDIRRSFDLTAEVPMRAAVLQLQDTEYELIWSFHHILMVDIHHIILDGVSQEILVQDFMALYNGGQLPQLRLRYIDFSVWQHKLFEQGLIKQQEAYWLTQFEEEVPFLDLHIDYPRPDSRTYAGKILKFQILSRTRLITVPLSLISPLTP